MCRKPDATWPPSTINPQKPQELEKENDNPRMFARLLPTLRSAATTSVRRGTAALPVARRNMSSSTMDKVYDSILSNNATYILAVVGTAAVVTGGFSVTVDAFWEFNNAGKLYDHVNWAAFAEEEDDDDDDDDDDE